MTKFKWFVPMLVLTSMIVWVATSYGEEINGADKKAAYAELIDRYAAGCESQSMFRDSRSEKLRQKAALSCLKAAFLRSYKNHIIQALMDRNVTPKPYKIHYFVNNLFYDLIRREKTMARTHAIPSGYIAVEQTGEE